MGVFLAHVLRLDDARWEPLWRIDSELAWGAGWGIELGPPLHGWQWGLNDDASNFVPYRLPVDRRRRRGSDR